MTTTDTAPCGRRHQPECGSALVEAALATPLVVVLLVATVSVGLIWRDQLAVDEAAATGARVASLHPSTLSGWLPPGQGPVAGSAATLDAVAGSLGAVPLQSVERVVIFVPDGPPTWPGTLRIPTGCRHGITTAPRCVTAVPIESDTGVRLETPHGDCGPGTCVWRTPAAGGGRPTEVGVYVAVRRGWLGSGTQTRIVDAVAIVSTEGSLHGR